MKATPKQARGDRGAVSPLTKLASMANGNAEIMSDEELDAIVPFDISNIVRSKPNPRCLGLKDRWECWIEHRDLKRFELPFKGMEQL